MMNGPQTTVEQAVDYSLVIPVYNNAGSLEQLVDRLHEELVDPLSTLSCEIVFVEDGSSDESYETLLALRKRYPSLIRVVKLTRNFGQPAARLAGLRHARGQRVISMAADGQEPPAVAKQMLERSIEKSAEVVIGARAGRDETWFRKVTSNLFFGLMRNVSFQNMPSGGFSFVLLGRRALDALLANQESHPFFQGQVLWLGYTPEVIHFHRPARLDGKSGWTFRKKLTLLIDALVSYSFLPIRVMSLVGVSVAFTGLLYSVLLLFKKLVFGTVVQGWAGIMIAVLVIGGIQILMLGVIGEYLWRTLAQSRGRDEYVIESCSDDRPETGSSDVGR